MTAAEENRNGLRVLKHTLTSMIHRILIIAVYFVALAGCSRPFSVEYRPGGPLTLASAPRDGDYALFAKGAVAPEFSAPLRRGELLGFRLSEDGKLVGVAGSYSQLLRPQKWRFSTTKFRDVSHDPGTSGLFTGLGIGAAVASDLTGITNSDQVHHRQFGQPSSDLYP